MTYINGNKHLANSVTHGYDDLQFVIESPTEGAVRLTIYKGDEPRPLSKETYGSCNLDQ